MQVHIERTGPHRFEASVATPLAEMVKSLTAQVRELLVADTDDPRLARLFPPGYGTDAERDREYQVLVRDELLARRLSSLEVLDEGLASPGPTELDVEGLTAWMTALNDVRLVLGTVLDVREDEPRVRRGDPRASGLAAYDVLTHVLAHVLAALEEDHRSPG